jgi:LCP family protein required for cell wall assembly
MTKNNSNTKEKESKIVRFFVILFLIIALATSAFAIYELFLLSSIETTIRYIVMGLLAFIDLIFILKTFKKKKKKKKRPGIFIVVMIIYSLICFTVGGIIFYIYGQLDNLNKNTITYTSNLLVMSSNPANNVSDIKDMKIGILSDTKNPEGYIIPQEIIDDNKLQDDNDIIKYDDYTSMLVDMYTNEIGAMFVSGNYVSMFSGITGYENIENDTKIIISKDKEMKKAATSKIETSSAGKSITEPFTILLMGIDSTEEVLTKNAIANGDTLILITFNPKTLNATMISIPRDSYVPIACWSGKPENKITHAAAYGNDCMINTIQNYFDVNIDYYAKLNFKGLVKLVDAVGGVEVDVNVDHQLCTDDSGRINTVCINPGHQVLNGEEALVYARNRKQLANGDFGRAQHQQEIVMALVNKMKTINDVSTFMNILNTISNSMDTNLTTKQILSFYDVGKDIIKKSLSSSDADLINIQQMFLDGTGQMIYDERARMVLWDYVPNNESRKDIIQAMKENLELADHKDITEFHFSINNPYEKTVIGQGPYRKGFSYTLLPDFTGDTEAQARATASQYGISVKFVGKGGTVVSQSEPAKRRVDLIKGTVTLTLSESENVKEKDDDEVTDKKKEKDKDKDTDKDEITDDDDEKEKDTDKNDDDDKPSTPSEPSEPTPSPSSGDNDNNSDETE